MVMMLPVVIRVIRTVELRLRMMLHSPATTSTIATIKLEMGGLVIR